MEPSRKRYEFINFSRLARITKYNSDERFSLSSVRTHPHVGHAGAVKRWIQTAAENPGYRGTPEPSRVPEPTQTGPVIRDLASIMSYR